MAKTLWPYQKARTVFIASGILFFVLDIFFNIANNILNNDNYDKKDPDHVLACTNFYFIGGRMLPLIMCIVFIIVYIILRKSIL